MIKLKKTELNEIIREKISIINDSDDMKNFLIEILEFERTNFMFEKTHYTKEYENQIKKYNKKLE